jgi:predicted O-methyltransferase YrrM
MHQETLENAPSAPIVKSEWLRWFEDKEFTSDWTTNRFPHWFPALTPFRDQAVQVLDVGSFEGRSSIVFLEYLPVSTVTTIDIFWDAEIEGRFDRNLASYADRVRKIKGRAAHVLDDFCAKGRKFDVIYLDAAKMRDEVFAQSALAWPLLKVGGVLIWDDLLWERERPAEERPEYGIRHFCAAFADSLNILHDGYQMIAIKTHDWPKTKDIVNLGNMVEKWVPARPRKQIRKIRRKLERKLIRIFSRRQSTS